MERYRMDDKGFLFVDGVKICRVNGQELEFLDKNKHRCSERGEPVVKVDILELVQWVANPVAERAVA